MKCCLLFILIVDNNYSFVYIQFLLFLLSSALTKKLETLLDPAKDDYKYDNLKKAWALLHSDFVAKSHFAHNMITLKKFNSYYQEDSITFLFSARIKKGPVEIYKASVARYKDTMKSVVYEKIPIMTKITIHDTAYILIHDEIISYANQRKLQFSHVERIEQYSDELGKFKLCKVTVRMKKISDDVIFYVLIDKEETYGYIFQIVINQRSNF